MALPSIAVRVSELHGEMDKLLAWSGNLPAGLHWRYQLNELRFVRATLAWEEFVEQSFLCFLRGSRSVLGRSYALAVPPPANVAAAGAVAIGNSPFGKWLNEKWTLKRAASVFSGAHPFMSLASPQFPEIRTIRNRIVHRSENARAEFQQVVASLYGSSKPGMTPGRLLSDASSGTPRIEVYLQLLKTSGSLVAQ